MSFEMGRATGWNAARTALRIAATQYARIHVPDVSPLWHPYTVISTLTEEDGEGRGDVEYLFSAVQEF